VRVVHCYGPMARVSEPDLVRSLVACRLDWLVTVPATGLGRVYEYYANLGRCLYCTREEEAVAVASGLTLVGQRVVVMMQQSGCGNCLNAVLSLSDAYGIYFPIIVVFRPIRDENPVQRVSVRKTYSFLRGLGPRTWPRRPGDSARQLHRLLRRRTRWIVTSA